MMSSYLPNVDALSNHQGPTFSASEQALFGGYNHGEASLFGGSSSSGRSSTMTSGSYTGGLWAGKKNSAAAAQQAAISAAASSFSSSTKTNNNKNNDVPSQGEIVESLTFMPQTMRGAKSSFTPSQLN
jgi:hypothetical protein